MDKNHTILLYKRWIFFKYKIDVFKNNWVIINKVFIFVFAFLSINKRYVCASLQF